MANPSVFTVSQLNREAKRLLAQHFLTVQVQGEISNLSLPASGHAYFTLKDAQAQVRCAMFKGQQSTLRFKPANGLQVLVSAQVSLYEPRGDYQLVVERMEAAGEGALRQAFEQLKVKLSAEGLFDSDRKQPLPLIPARIGVITSPSGAAIRDILTVLKRRFPAIPVVIYPVAVQGEAAQFEISAALAAANRDAAVDLVILARGGGSLEDLWAFNEERVARAIAASRLPVIVGVGHETDVTIADFVADLRAPTPSAAAEHAVPEQAAWLYAFTDAERRLTRLMQLKLSSSRQQLAWREKALQAQHPGEKLHRNAQRLDELERRLAHAQQRRLSQQRQHWLQIEARLKQAQPTAALERYRNRLEFLEQRLAAAMNRKLADLAQRQAAAGATLHAVSPLATLQRGYAIVQRHGETAIIKSAADLAVGDWLDIRLASGQVVSEVKRLTRDVA